MNLENLESAVRREYPDARFVLQPDLVIVDRQGNGLDRTDYQLARIGERDVDPTPRPFSPPPSATSGFSRGIQNPLTLFSDWPQGLWPLFAVAGIGLAALLTTTFLPAFRVKRASLAAQVLCASFAGALAVYGLGSGDYALNHGRQEDGESLIGSGLVWGALSLLLVGGLFVNLSALSRLPFGEVLIEMPSAKAVARRLTRQFARTVALTRADLQAAERWTAEVGAQCLATLQSGGAKLVETPEALKYCLAGEGESGPFVLNLLQNDLLVFAQRTPGNPTTPLRVYLLGSMERLLKFWDTAWRGARNADKVSALEQHILVALHHMDQLYIAKYTTLAASFSPVTLSQLVTDAHPGWMTVSMMQHGENLAGLQIDMSNAEVGVDNLLSLLPNSLA